MKGDIFSVGNDYSEQLRSSYAEIHLPVTELQIFAELSCNACIKG